MQIYQRNIHRSNERTINLGVAATGTELLNSPEEKEENFADASLLLQQPVANERQYVPLY
jgi:hypothetical protein